MERQRALIVEHLRPLCERLEVQEFLASVESLGTEVAMANVIASWGVDRPARVLVCSHYDTRPMADREPDWRDWEKPFLGANDGGSSTAFLMELARHLGEMDLRVGVDLVFFDGEEFIHDRRVDRYFLGSKHYARRLGDQGEKPRAAVLLDMIAGVGARFEVEWYALKDARRLTRRVWEIAAEEGCGAFVAEVGHAVQDDHLPLIKAGIPATVIIDIEYPHWHLLTDLPENCEAGPVDEVARVVLAWLREQKA
jgi:Zn-dependent M28 family amino/carboxypeptidase